MKRFGSVSFAVALALGASANAASVTPTTGPQDPSQLNATINAAIGRINQGVPGFSGTTGQNYLDNGSFSITQRGTGDTTGGSTAGCAIASYPADRWCVDTNVVSGVGHGQVVTSSPSPPPGFSNSVKVWRASGALTQPVNLMQEIETARAVQLQGKSVIASCYVQPLAGLTSASGAVQMSIFTGTGVDQGLGALRSAVGMTASPAQTPAWTGIGTVALTSGFNLSVNGSGLAQGTANFPLGTTAAWNRVWSSPATIPQTATELAFVIGFTPVGSSSGATDGFAVTGCQLEAADPNQVTPSAYNFLPLADALARAQRFFWQMTDVAATVPVASACNVTTADTTVKCGVWLPAQMQAVPVTTVSTATSFGIWLTAGTAGTCTTLAATATSSTVRSIGVTCTTGGTIALGTGTVLIGAATAGTLSASADF